MEPSAGSIGAPHPFCAKIPNLHKDGADRFIQLAPVSKKQFYDLASNGTGLRQSSDPITIEQRARLRTLFTETPSRAVRTTCWTLIRGALSRRPFANGSGAAAFVD